MTALFLSMESQGSRNAEGPEREPDEAKSQFACPCGFRGPISWHCDGCQTHHLIQDECPKGYERPRARVQDEVGLRSGRPQLVTCAECRMDFVPRQPNQRYCHQHITGERAG